MTIRRRIRQQTTIPLPTDDSLLILYAEPSPIYQINSHFSVDQIGTVDAPARLVICLTDIDQTVQVVRRIISKVARAFGKCERLEIVRAIEALLHAQSTDASVHATVNDAVCDVRVHVGVIAQENHQEIT